MATKPLLLMLYGVKLEDLVEKVVTPIESCALLTYTKMPEEYIKGGYWPQTSNLKCWECHEIPTGRPRFIPLNYNKREEKASVYGHFCRIECVCAHIIARWPEHKRPDLLAAARIIESHPIFSGRYQMFVSTTIPITALKEYCGPSGMTRPDWERANAALANDTSTVYKTADYDVGYGRKSRMGR